MSDDPLRVAANAAATLASLTGVQAHEVAIVLGTGLADAADSIGTPGARLSFADLPGFPSKISPGQRPEIWSMDTEGVAVLVLRGRLHLYEGHSAQQVAHPVRTAVLAGCRTIFITNASGGIRTGYSTGDLVLISDHLNLTGVSPLTGLPSPDDSSEPGRGRDPFVDLTDAWSARLRALALDIDDTLQEGVYAQLPGPHFETPAEIRMLRQLGADLVGMSSAVEAIAARHLGAEVLGLSIVTNPASGLAGSSFAPGEIAAAARARSEAVGRILREVLLRM